MAPSTHPIPARPPRPLGHRRAVRTIAALTAAAGLLQLLALLPFVHTRLDGDALGIDPIWLPVTGHVVSVVVGLPAHPARRPARQAQAARLAGRAVGLFAIGAVAHLVKGPHPVAIALCVGMIAALLVYRNDFHAPADPPSLFRVARFVPIYLVGVLVFGFVALWTQSGAVTPDRHVRRRRW